MFKTKMTELFGIKHPIMLAGMNWITDPNLVATVCNAGGLGILATARYTPDELRKCIKEIKTLTDKPFGINQMLLMPGAQENIKIAIEEKVPVVNYTLGKPWFVDQVHAYGGKVLGTTALAKHAVKAAQLGCDAIVITGHEAAAHGADATSLVLIPTVASQVKIPIIAAGGFYDGRGLAAALSLGADGISMGTRFMLTQESALHANFKQLCLEATEQDTLYDTVFDGMPGRALKSKGAIALTKRGFPIIDAAKGAMQIKKMLKLSTAQFVGLSLKMMSAGEESSPLWVQARQAAGVPKHLKGIFEGDKEEGVLFASQCIGDIRDIPTCAELIDRVIKEAQEAIKKTSAQMQA
ncbi:MAG: nitronate monooxygenase [Deltaproteobacteria bacterium]|nr:nitronate monooxygenase [Deltaproteobacteria bacterium]